LNDLQIPKRIPNQHKNRRKSTKNASKFFLSSFNTQTMSNDFHLLQMKNALKNIEYDIVGLCEVKREGEKKEKKNTRRRGSVGLIVNIKWKKNIKFFKSFSDRVCMVVLDFGNSSLAVIQVYAPTSTAPLSEIEELYEQIS
jgi:exonuclease III